MIIYNKIIHHISCQINPSQFGSMQNRFTTQQLLKFLSDAFTTHHQLDTIYLDISKDFNTVCHAHLLHKLSSFNISDNLWKIRNDSLYQSTILNCISFQYYQAYLRVASWGNFCSYCTWMTFQMPSTGVKHYFLPDDTKCFKHIKSPVDQQHLHFDLDNLASWSISSHLSFNSSKSTHVSLNNRTPTSYKMTPLPPSIIVKILELLLAVILIGTSIMMQFIGKLTGPSVLCKELSVQLFLHQLKSSYIYIDC